MHKVAADLTRMLGSERVLWEAEHLATYGFDGTPALYAEAGCVTFAENYRGGNSGRPLRGAEQNSGRHAWLRHRFKRRQRAGAWLHRALLGTDGPGARAKVAELADAAGLLYPPDPGSMKISTIGGNVAENSGGLRGLKYGVTLRG